MASELPVIDESIASYVVLLIAVSLGLIVLYRNKWEKVEDWREKASDKLIYGLPIATIIIVAVNVGFFLFIQRAFFNSGKALTIPFYSWTYFYPLGQLTAPIAHSGVGHITGNMVSTLVLGSATEYIIGHRNKDGEKSILRAVLVIPVIWYVIGVLTQVFIPGAGIGFSVVVFAFMGFVAVFYPLKAIGLVIVTDIAQTLYNTALNPVVIESGRESFVTPWWAYISFHGHLMGLLIGVLLGVFTVRKSNFEIDINPFVVGLSIMVIAIMESIYAIWTIRGSSFVLFQGIGMGFVILIGILTIYGLKRVESDDILYRVDGMPLSRMVSYTGLLLPVLIISLIALPVNSATFANVSPDDAIEVDGYQVWYGEDVQNKKVSSIPFIDVLPLIDATGSNFTVSGVIVSNNKKGIWFRVVTKNRLKVNQRASFYVGDLTWQDKIVAKRYGVSTAAGKKAYSVVVTNDDDESIYTSDPAPTGTKMNGWNISLGVNKDTYRAVLEKRNQTRRADLTGNRTSVEGIDFVVKKKLIIATNGNTTTVVGKIKEKD